MARKRQVLGVVGVSTAAARASLWIVVVLTSFVILTCSRQKEESPGEILARVGDKVITLDEFLRRAEYTPRPAYCRGDNYIHRKIVLNTLIAEKLLAMEAGADAELLHNDHFRAYLRGRQEQAMRQWLFYKDFYAKARPKPEQVRERFGLTTRTYRVAYYSFSGDSLLALVKDKLSAGGNFAEGFQLIGGIGQAPEREVAWNQAEHEAIRRALFSRPLAKGQIIGPVEAEDGLYTVMQVQGWTEKVLLSDTQQRQHWTDVEASVRQEQAEQAYLKFVQRLMSGKKMVFVEDTFYRLAATLAPLFLASPQQKRLVFNRFFWQKDSGDVVLDHDPMQDIGRLRTMPLMQLDGQTWTVADLEQELEAHPLVFRTRHIRKGEFAAQLRLAIADLIRDKYIAQAAYKRGYHKALPVRRTVQMWQDHILALHQRNQYLRSMGQDVELSRVDTRVIERYLNPYIRELQRKYGDQIEINMDLFEQTKLSRIDMLVLQRGAPYPVVVPMFPLLTTLHPIDYGRKAGT
ncbi:MAG: hypothetical protein ONB25_01160 [candidate division KSB1 bacterium]|nr:hypothetical protein [candidate division KSB1 bacterium]